MSRNWFLGSKEEQENSSSSLFNSSRSGGLSALAGKDGGSPAQRKKKIEALKRKTASAECVFNDADKKLRFAPTQVIHESAAQNEGTEKKRQQQQRKQEDAAVLLQKQQRQKHSPRSVHSDGRNRRAGKNAVRSPTTPKAAEMMLDRRAEKKRWCDVLATREAQGKGSPMTISVNPLRFHHTERIEQVTGVQPSFSVNLPDPFLPTPERRKVQQRVQKSGARLLTFSTNDVAEPMQVEDDDDLLPSHLALDPEVPFTHYPRPVTPGASKKKGARLVRSPSFKSVKQGSAVAAAISTSAGASAAAAANKKATLRKRRHSRRFIVMQQKEGRSLPSWGTPEALTSWVMEHGTTEDKRRFAYGHTHVLPSNALLETLKRLFYLDNHGDRPIRRGMFVFIGFWLDCLEFQSPFHCTEFLGSLQTWLRKIYEKSMKMTREHHALAWVYAPAGHLSKRMDVLCFRILKGLQTKAAVDRKLYFQPDSATLKPQASQIALYACLASSHDPSSNEFCDELTPGGRGLSEVFKRKGLHNFLKQDSKKLAAAMTHLDHEMFRIVTGEDLLIGTRSGNAVQELSINRARLARVNHLVNITVHWNKVSRWVPTTVLYTGVGERDGSKKRAEVVRHFIKLAAELRDLHNWSSFFAVMIGLGSTIVTTLKETWRLVPYKYTQLFKEMEEMVQPIHNFRVYRDAVEKGAADRQFCVPYLAIILKDLQAIDEGNSEENRDGLVNYDKVNMLGMLCRRVHQWQQTHGGVKQPDKKYLYFVTHMVERPEAELWKQSKKVKAQEKEAREVRKTRKWGQ